MSTKKSKSAKQTANAATTPQSVFTPHNFFPTTVYTIIKTEFLESVNLVANEALDNVKKDHELNETYPAVMSTGMMGDTRIRTFEKFIADSAWTVLNTQGYNMSQYQTYVSELWCQEHFRFSGMEEHVHPYGVLLSGFYFLETPQDGPMINVHDPRPGKVQASLPERDNMKVTHASN